MLNLDHATKAGTIDAVLRQLGARVSLTVNKAAQGDVAGSARRLDQGAPRPRRGSRSRPVGASVSVRWVASFPVPEVFLSRISERKNLLYFCVTYTIKAVVVS